MRPLLADKIKDYGKLRFPLFASAKLDGIRLLGYGPRGGMVSRNLKPLANRYIDDRLRRMGLKHYDGEIIVGEPNLQHLTYRNTQTATSTQEGEPRFTLYVFDHFEFPTNPWQFRFGQLREFEDDHGNRVVVHQHDLIKTLDELYAYEEMRVEQGYEGVMVRSPDGEYKFGRSSERQGILLKMVRLETDEAEIIGFKERMHNANEATISAQGYTERTSHRANMIGRGDLGAFIARCPRFNEPIFDVGSGLDDNERAEIWANKEKYLGKIITFQYRPYGIKDKPRFPIFKGFRTDKGLHD